MPSARFDAFAQGYALGWQSIKSAPRDGTPVILYVPDSQKKIWLGRFYHHSHSINGRVTSESEEWSLDGAFYSISAQKQPQPTMWMPIPEVPEECL